MGVMVQYLQADKKTGRLSYRRAFPSALRPHIVDNPREFVRSLKVRSMGETGAGERYEKAHADYEALATLARKAASGTFDTLDAPTIAYLSTAYAVERLEQDEAMRWDTEERELIDTLSGGTVDTSSRFMSKRRETLEGMGAHYKGLQAAGDLKGIVKLWAEDVEDFVAAKGYRFDTQSRDFVDLCRATNEAAIKSNAVNMKRLEGEIIPTPDEPERPSLRKSQSVPKTELQATMQELSEELSASRANPVSRATQDARNTAIRYWTEAFDNLPHSSITRAHVSEWLELLACLPVRPTRSERRLPIRKLVEKYEGREAQRLNSKTLFSHITKLTTIWNFAERRGLIEADKRNPFSRHDIKASNSRKATGLTIAELNAMLSLPVFKAGERPAGCRGEAAYWMPLILLFTGARPSEVAQLLTSDFQSRKDGLYITFTDEGVHPAIGERRLKTSESDIGRRTFPVPQALIDLGIKDYLAWLESQGQSAMFPQLPAWSKGLAEAWSRWWGPYVRKAGAIPADKRQAREFRHCFPTAARASGVSGEALAYIQGHAPKGTNETYGSRAPLGAEIRKVEYEGLDVSVVKAWVPPRL